MTTRTTLFTAVLALLIFSASGQRKVQDKKPLFVIKSDLLFLSLNASGLVRTGALTLEKGFGDRHSFQLTGGYISGVQTRASRWHLVPEYKFFLNKEKNYSGFYTGAYLKYRQHINEIPYLSTDGNDKYFAEKFMSYGAGATFGYQTYLKKHLTLDFLVGLGVQHIQRKMDQPANVYFMDGGRTYPYTGIDGRVSFNLGYRF